MVVPEENWKRCVCRFLHFSRDTLYISDMGLHKVYIVNMKDKKARVLGEYGAHPGFLNEPAGISCDGNGNIIVADSKNNRIQVLSL